MKNLKKLLAMLSLAIFVALSFSSCKDKDSEPTSDDLLGKWMVTSAEWTEKENGRVTDSDRETYGEDEFYFIFKPKGICIYGEDGYEDEGEWFLSGKTLVIFDDEVWTIESRSSKSMTLTYSDSWVNDGVKYEENIKMKLSKVW